MSVTLDLSGDWQVWDNREAIDFESSQRLPLGATTDHYENCKRRALTKKELYASNGAYTGRDRVWLIPVQMAPELAAKPADVVVDGDGTRWTVLEAGLNTYDTWWRLVCRDLVIEHDLRDRIDVQSATLETDAAGAYVKLFPPDGGETLYENLPCRVHPESEEIADQRGIRGDLQLYRIIVDRQITVNVAENRVKWTDRFGTVRYLDLVGYKNPEQIGELPYLDAMLKP